MVSYKDIDKAIALKLKSKFLDIEITSTDIEEGITRPSFFIDFRGVSSQDFMTVSLDRTIPVVIYYSPKEKEKNKIELLEKRSDLETLMLEHNILQIDEFTNAEIESLNFEKVDKVLLCMFEINSILMNLKTTIQI